MHIQAELKNQTQWFYDSCINEPTQLRVFSKCKTVS